MSKKKPSKKQTFLHDLVNHTHGLLLFLNQKKRLGHISSTDLDQLISEIKLMQTFIKNEWEYQHRDLSINDPEVGLDEIFKIASSLLSVYFSQNLIDLKTNLDPSAFSHLENFKLNSVAFFRILTNVVKNIIEAGPTVVEINFEIDDLGILKIVSKNDYKVKVDSGNRLSSPVGLFSIKKLVEEMGGTFESSCSDAFWENLITIPLISTSNNTQKVA